MCIIQRNQSVAMRLLQVANSPALRVGKSVASIQDAITTIGISLVKNLVFCLSLKDKFSSKDAHLNTILEAAWCHSVDIAAACAMISRHFKLPRDKALMLGLTHNIGILPIVDYYTMCKDTADIEETIQHIGAKLSASILSEWKMPFDIVDAILYEQYCLAANSPVTFTELLHFAHVFTELGDDGFTAVLQDYGISSDKVHEIVSSLDTKTLAATLK